MFVHLPLLHPYLLVIYQKHNKLSMVLLLLPVALNLYYLSNDQKQIPLLHHLVQELFLQSLHHHEILVQQILIIFLFLLLHLIHILYYYNFFSFL